VTSRELRDALAAVQTRLQALQEAERHHGIERPLLAEVTALAEIVAQLVTSSAGSPWLNGWKAIAAHVDHCERWARKVAARAADPMPISRCNGCPTITRCALDAWYAAQQQMHPQTGRARPPGSGRKKAA
jgi:hypothetical protein